MKGLHEALGIESTWGFVLCLALAGGVFFGGLAWIADKSYKRSLQHNSLSGQSPHSSATIDPKEQTEIIRQLSSFAEEGNQLIINNRQRARGVEWPKAKNWAERAEAYIKQHINEQQAAYFSLATTKPYPGLAVDRRFVDWVQTRIDRLGEIALEVRNSSVKTTKNNLVRPASNPLATQHQAQVRPIQKPLSLDPLPVRIRKANVDVTGEVSSRERSVFEGSELVEKEVAIAEFYRPADDSGESFVDVRGHVTFYDPVSGEPERRVNDALWWGVEGEYATFHQGDSKNVIVAILNDGKVFPYQGQYEREGEWYHGTIFKAELEPLNGSAYQVRIELIGTRGGIRKMENLIVAYELSADPPSWKLG